MATVKPEPHYEVFISYRRGTADELALLLQTHLQKRGTTAFLDRDLRRGVFDDTLLRHIAESPTFLIILTPRALDRCTSPEDWLRKEIVQAISSKRNIIPLQVDSFQFTAEVVRALDPAIRELSRYQTLEYSRTYFEHTVERIVKIVEENKADRKAAEEATGEEKRRTERAKAEGHLESRRSAAASSAGDERVQVDLPKNKSLAMKGQNVRQGRASRKGLWASGILAIFMIVIFIGVGGLRFFIPSSVSPSPTLAKKEVLPSEPTPITTATIAAGTIQINPKDNQKYVWIPSGRFLMGCSADDSECQDDEKPPHWVTFKKGFWLEQTPVTQSAYQRVMNANPSRFPGEQLPVETVTWYEAKSYCEAVAGRLPTEAEWEYAARAGTTTSRYGDVDAIAWYGDNSGRTRLNSLALWRNDRQNYIQKLQDNGNQTHRVHLKQPNKWGLYDMLGNVWEWVSDWYGERYYQELDAENPENPRGPKSGEYRVIRGGCWYLESWYLRSSFRHKVKPSYRDALLGFRCAREMF